VCCLVTKEIARYVHQVINLPADVTAALARLDALALDVLLFPDWQPFPDAQSTFFQAIRIAPVQVISSPISCSSVLLLFLFFSIPHSMLLLLLPLLRS
jgi:hypothetical protein